MVNHILLMVNIHRAKILKALRARGDYVSGEVLSKELGISRVSVWKHIRSLGQQGYVLDSSPRGYRLTFAPDLLLPYELPGWEQETRHFQEIDSTMDEARRLAKAGAGEGVVVVAESQTHGRGRLSREWSSPRGGIYCTLLLRPQLAPAYAPRINLMASVAVARAIRKLFGLPAELKWPNDVLIRGRKVCGILSEMEAETDAIKYVNVGIGINVNSSVSQSGATSVSDQLGRNSSRKELLTAVLEEISEQQRLLTRVDLLDEWRKLSATLNRNVRIAAFGEEIEGKAVDIDANGALVVRCRDNSLRNILAGDCFHL